MSNKYSKDPLGERIKHQYENRTRYCVPRRTYTLLRLDGKSFHSYTKGLNKPFDAGLYEDINMAIVDILPEIQGAVFAYTQSDEISILLTDFATPTTDAWFDGNIQKTCSVSASLMTSCFNKQRTLRYMSTGLSVNIDEWNHFASAVFDSRVFTIPDRVEVMNYFRWRQADCIRNSVSMVAQSNFSHKELHGKSQSDMHEMLHTKGINWANDFSDGEKNGRIILKKSFVEKLNPTDEIPITRTRWVADGAWVFTKDEGKLLNMIPPYESL